MERGRVRQRVVQKERGKGGETVEFKISTKKKKMCFLLNRALSLTSLNSKTLSFFYDKKTKSHLAYNFNSGSLNINICLRIFSFFFLTKDKLKTRFVGKPSLALYDSLRATTSSTPGFFNRVILQ